MIFRKNEGIHLNNIFNNSYFFLQVQESAVSMHGEGKGRQCLCDRGQLVTWWTCWLYGYLQSEGMPGKPIKPPKSSWGGFRPWTENHLSSLLQQYSWIVLTYVRPWFSIIWIFFLNKHREVNFDPKIIFISQQYSKTLEKTRFSNVCIFLSSLSNSLKRDLF